MSADIVQFAEIVDILPFGPKPPAAPLLCVAFARLLLRYTIARPDEFYESPGLVSRAPLSTYLAANKVSPVRVIDSCNPADHGLIRDMVASIAAKSRSLSGAHVEVERSQRDAADGSVLSSHRHRVTFITAATQTDLTLLRSVGAERWVILRSPFTRRQQRPVAALS